MPGIKRVAEKELLKPIKRQARWFNPSSIPSEVWAQIFSQDVDLLKVRTVCRSFLAILINPLNLTYTDNGTQCLKKINKIIERILENHPQLSSESFFYPWFQGIKSFDLSGLILTQDKVSKLAEICPNIEDLTLRKVIIRKTD